MTTPTYDAYGHPIHQLVLGGIPREVITRALISARSLADMEKANAVPFDAFGRPINELVLDA